jgi:hypothetical protein
MAVFTLRRLVCVHAAYAHTQVTCAQVAYALHRAATCTQLHDDRQEKWRAEAMRRLHHTVPQYEKVCARTL